MKASELLKNHKKGDNTLIPYSQRMTDAGYKRLTLWIRKEWEPEFKTLYTKLKAEHDEE